MTSAFAEVRQVSWWHTIVRLFKLRVVMLLLWEALAGALLAAARWQGLGRDLLVLLVSGLLAAGGASALNEYIEQDLDRQMRRTQSRPLPSGQVPGWVALWSGLFALALGVGLAFWYRPALGVFVAAGAFIYVVVYTLGLKRRSVVNIVIGGAAGSCAVLSGAAAVGNWSSPPAWILAALVFLWTPVHFWALALVYREDYRKAGFPMLPAVASVRTTLFWIWVHAVAMTFAALALAPWMRFQAIYVVVVLALSLWMAYALIRLGRQPTRERAFRAFMTSNLYLAGVTLAAMLGAWPG